MTEENNEETAAETVPDDEAEIVAETVPDDEAEIASYLDALKQTEQSDSQAVCMGEDESKRKHTGLKIAA